MVKCPHCNQETDGSKKYCVHCGKEIKSGYGTFKKVLIVFFAILVFTLLINGTVNYIGSINSDEGTVVNTDSQIASTDQIESSEEDNFSHLNNLFSSSTETVDFNGIFTMEVDNNEHFEKINVIDYLNSDEHWDSEGKNEDIKIYYWKNKNLDYKLKNIEDHYENPVVEDNLTILTSQDLDEKKPKNDDYMVFVHNDEDIVAIQGHNLEKIKGYANSVQFTN